LKLISLELTNYRRFKQAKLEFSDGVIGILGLNGVGKSTIIEAVAWVLYGNEFKIIRTKKEDLKRYGSSPNEVCEVRLSFDLDGDKYLVTRKMAGKKFQTTAEVIVNGASLAKTTKSVTELVEARLGMDYQAFYTSVFAKQKELNALSILDPSKRKKLILRMLNIDSIDISIINVRRDARDYNSRLNELRSILIEPDGKPKIEIIKGQMKENIQNMNEVTEVISGLEKNKNEIFTSLKELEVSRADLRKLRDEYNRLKTSLTESSMKIQNMEEQFTKLESELEDLTNQKQELDKLEQKRSDWVKVKTQKEELEEVHGKFIRSQELREQVKKHDGLIKIQKEKIQNTHEEMKKFEGLDTNIEDCRIALDNVSEEVNGNKKTVSEYKSKITVIEDEIEKIEGKLKDIRSLGPESECPTCDRVLGEHYKILEDKFKAELRSNKGKINEHQKSMEKYDKSIVDLEKRLEALKKRDKYLSDQEKEYTRLEESIKFGTAQLKQYKSQRYELDTELNQFKDIKFDPGEFSKIKAEYKELEKINERYIALANNVEKIPQLEKERAGLTESKGKLLIDKEKFENDINKLGFDEKNLDQIETLYDSESTKLKDFELSIKGKENDLNLFKKEIDQLNKKIEELNEQEKKAEEYEDTLIYLNKLEQILNKFKNYMISRIAPTLTQFASDLLRELTDGKYNRMEIDNDYNVSIFDQGEEFPLSRFSGGEEDLANLCLRLAISQVISAQTGTTGPGFVILDEIFGSQDLHRKRNLLQSLNGLTNKFRQIFLITHIEDVKDYIQFNIIVTENDDQTSSVQIIG
jgi:exonuclease SbcC